jgi:acetolactate synthase-1/2/3 large subunit
MKLSDYVMQRIAAEGVKHVFFVPGGAAMHLNDSLGRCDGVEYISNLHEQASAIAAEAYARVSGGLGMAMVTAGPGSTNAVTGVAAAWLDSTPCIFLSGQAKSSDLKGDSGVRQMGVQEIGIVEIVDSITKYAVTITDPQSIRYHLEKALYETRSNRPGPVWLDIPLDIQAVEIEPENLPGFIPTQETSDEDEIAEKITRLIELWNTAERPVILAGNGIHVAGAERQFRELATMLGAPVLSTGLAADLLAADHPLYFGRPGAIAPRGANFTLQNSDLLLTIGCRLDMAFIGYSRENLAREAKKIVVDIDAAELRKFGDQIELPICADAKTFMEKVLLHGSSAKPQNIDAWLTRCREWKEKYPVVLPEHRAGESISAYHFSEVLSNQLQNNDIVLPGSSGFACEIFLLCLKVKEGQRCFHNRGTGAMGIGIPTALGACVAGGGRRTICVDGDGGFQFNIQELHTVAHLNLPIKFFVVNNLGYASIRVSQGNYFGLLVGCDAESGLPMPNISKIAEAYGLRTERIERPDDLESGIARALAGDDPVVCEIVTIPDEPREPRLASYKREDGMMVSKPLEDLYPFLPRDEFAANMIVAPLDESV